VIERLDPAVPLLQVFDMQTSLKFYCDVLGFQVVNKTGHDWWAMIRLGDATLMLNTAYEDDKRPRSPDAKRVRGHRDVPTATRASPPRSMSPEL
jgi:glyoxylase I family protein